jgi:hypothetical protein
MSVTSMPVVRCNWRHGRTNIQEADLPRAGLRRECVPGQRSTTGRDDAAAILAADADGRGALDRSLRRESSCDQQRDVRFAGAASRCSDQRRASDRDRRRPHERADQEGRRGLRRSACEPRCDRAAKGMARRAGRTRTRTSGGVSAFVVAKPCRRIVRASPEPVLRVRIRRRDGRVDADGRWVVAPA